MTNELQFYEFNPSLNDSKFKSSSIIPSLLPTSTNGLTNEMLKIPWYGRFMIEIEPGIIAWNTEEKQLIIYSLIQSKVLHIINEFKWNSSSLSPSHYSFDSSSKKLIWSYGSTLYSIDLSSISSSITNSIEIMKISELESDCIGISFISSNEIMVIDYDGYLYYFNITSLSSSELISKIKLPSSPSSLHLNNDLSQLIIDFEDHPLSFFSLKSTSTSSTSSILSKYLPTCVIEENPSSPTTALPNLL